MNSDRLRSRARARLVLTASTWMSVETANDSECISVAQEIYDVLQARNKVMPGPTNNLAADPTQRDIQVIVSSRQDEHFQYAQEIANILNTPTTPVRFGGPPRPKAGLIRIVVLTPALPLAATSQPYGVQQIAPGGTGYQANGPNARAGPVIVTSPPVQCHASITTLPDDGADYSGPRISDQRIS